MAAEFDAKQQRIRVGNSLQIDMMVVGHMYKGLNGLGWAKWKSKGYF